MKFTGKLGDLKSKGYTHQKLYANEYISYRKAVAKTHESDYSGMTVWVWSKGKTIEVADWHDDTEAIVKCFKDNLKKWANTERFSYSLKPDNMFRGSDLMHLIIHNESGKVRVRLISDWLKDPIHNRKLNDKALDDAFDEYYKSIEGYRDVRICVSQMLEVLKEIKSINA